MFNTVTLNLTIFSLYDQFMGQFSCITKTRFHLLKDRRIISFSEFGDNKGTPVFYSHGTPGSRLEGEILHQEALNHNFRLICIDRPGIGKSTYLPDRKLLDYPNDILEVANELKIAEFGLISWSSGGAHALACSYAMPDKILFNIVLAGYARISETTASPNPKQSNIDQFMLSLSRHSPNLFRFFYSLFALGMKIAPNFSYKAILNSMSKSDKLIANNDSFKSILYNAQKEAFNDGSVGVATDATIHYHDWGFNLEDIITNVHIFHGIEDQLVPTEFSLQNKAQIPSCELHLVEGEGHLFPCIYSKEIFNVASFENEKCLSKETCFRKKSNA